MDTVNGLIERVTFHSDENGFCVLKAKIAGFKDLIPVIGHAPEVSPGEYLKAQGNWISDKTHGRQFKAEFLKIYPPNTLEGIEKYLGSGMVKGIGPIYASKLVATFGENVFDIIETEPKRLLEVDGIGKVRMQKIAAGWHSQKIIKEIMLFLHSNGVSTSKAVRIYKTYGDSAVEIVKANPYKLAEDISGIGFLSADKIARNMGWEIDSPKRIQAGISFALLEASNDGHCGLPQSALVDKAVELLGVEAPLILTAIAVEKERKTLIEFIETEPVLYLAPLHYTEKSIAKQVVRLITGTSKLMAFDPLEIYEQIKPNLGLVLEESQEAALKSAVTSKVMVVTGNPGTGKTTTINAILKIFDAAKAKMLLCAPTGRAAKRITETTGRPAATIHRLLGSKPGGGTTYNDTNPLDCDLLVVDETSMVDIFVMNMLLKALPSHASLLIVGDMDQLPSVGPGKVLEDLMNSGSVGVARLTKIFRQAEGSAIVMGAHAVNRGEMPIIKQDGDLWFIQEEDHEAIPAIVLDLIKRVIPSKTKVDIKDIQVICPMNKSSTGVRNLNEVLQTALNPATQFVEKFGTKFKVGDKVMQTANDYDKKVYNGDIGFITKITEEDVLIDFNGESVTYDPAEMDNLQLAYATTIHKLQGSQAPVIIMTLTTQHFAMLQRNLIYTGITRGQNLVIIVGQKKALGMAVRNFNKVNRHTRLKQEIQAQVEDYLLLAH